MIRNGGIRKNLKSKTQSADSNLRPRCEGSGKTKDLSTLAPRVEARNEECMGGRNSATLNFVSKQTLEHPWVNLEFRVRTIFSPIFFGAILFTAAKHCLGFRSEFFIGLLRIRYLWHFKTRDRARNAFGIANVYREICFNLRKHQRLRFQRSGPLVSSLFH
ncbi:hypothetical protein AVEN_275051-1 [Araneus ventricosus]|uniref:Uncharacterized protein n=1 Tax=Araneus ventricosus TaxID=182803 RepID=A0A4Y2T0E0_ARAVE|nr:hypothetical protein AVEN_275051-1 [Araneus ventricosus]